MKRPSQGTRSPRARRSPGNERLRLGGLLLAAGVLLAGCATGNLDDLVAYVQQVLARPPRAIPEPLPEFKVPESYAYQAAEAGKRDPFESFLRTAAPQGPGAVAAKDPKTEQLRREIELHGNPEELESFELDALRMVGTLQDAEELWGVVRDPTGTVHRVKVGNYLGKNYGKVISISEERIELREIVSTSDGGLEERSATLALTEQ